MNFNKESLKRFSTYANFISMVVSAALLSLDGVGLEPTAIAQIMLVGNMVVAGCQAIRQQAG